MSAGNHTAIDARDKCAALSAGRDAAWDAFVANTPGGDHLQTSAWSGVKALQGWNPVRVTIRQDAMLLGGAQLLVRRTPFGSIAFCPRGPLTIGHDPEIVQRVLGEISTLARRRRFLYIKVQPPIGRSDIEPALRQNGFFPSDMPAAPVASVLINVCRDDDELLAEMRPATRANIRKAIRKGVTASTAGTQGLARFEKLLIATGRRQHFPPYPIAYYSRILTQFGAESASELLLVEAEGETLAGALLVGYGDTVVYKMGAWAGTRSDLHPNELMHWRAIQWARNHGFRYYDLEGIHQPIARLLLQGHEVPRNVVPGTTHFKLGFGGDVVLYPQAYDRSFHPALVLPVRLVAGHSTRLSAFAQALLGRRRAST